MFGPGEGVPVVLSEVNCTGGEDRLTDCPSAGFHQQSSACGNSPGVNCSGSGKGMSASESKTTFTISTVVGAVAGCLVLIVVFVIVMMVVLCYQRWRRKKRLTDWQLDIMEM